MVPGLLGRVRQGANHSGAVPVPETGSEGISADAVYVAAVRVRTYAASCEAVSPRFCVPVATCARAEDIESDSHRAGHNFRPTRSELLMTSLPPLRIIHRSTKRRLAPLWLRTAPPRSCVLVFGSFGDGWG